MKEIPGFAEIKENQGGEFERLPAGGYVCVITAVEDVPEKEYLKIEFDIAEGEYKGCFADTYQRAGFWGGRFIRSYKESAAGFFKGFTSAIENSNEGFRWTWDETALIKKKIGLVLGYEEFINKDGEIKERLTVVQNRSVASILSGDFKVPALKTLKPEDVPVGARQGFRDIPSNTKIPF